MKTFPPERYLDGLDAGLCVEKFIEDAILSIPPSGDLLGLERFDVQGGGGGVALYQGPRVIAFAMCFRDPLNWSVVIKADYRPEQV